MATLLRVPEVAAGATEVILSEWLVDERGLVKAGAPVAVVETEKAIVEVESDTSGVVLRRLVEDGTTVDVGSAIALIGTDAELDADLNALLAELGLNGTDGSGSAATDPREGEEPEAAEPQTPAGTVDAATEPETAPEPEVDPRPSGEARDRIFATPVARRVLADAGIDIETVTGTGPNGRILKKDAEDAARSTSATSDGLATDETTAEKAVPKETRATAGAGYADLPHSRLRKAVATRLTTSKQTVPHFYVARSVRVDALISLRQQLNEVSPQRLSVNDLVVRAVATAHVAVPEANVTWTDDALRRYDSVDVGVAIAGDRGLVTPVLRDVGSTSPSGIAQRVREFVQQANEGKLQQRDLEGGSISVTNLGMYGVEAFSAIINPPQSAILAVGAALPAAVVVDGALEVGSVMSLVLSVDHRAIDGALAARWMAALVVALEEPMRLLA